jgi:hypothetical protein
MGIQCSRCYEKQARERGTRPDEVRAIIVSRLGLNAPRGLLGAAFDAAGDQQRTHWCTTHNHEAFDRKYEGWSCPHNYRCRVVTAIIVPLEEDA